MFGNRLVVEVDGGQHGEEAIARRDKERTRRLNGKGYLVVRFWNGDILGGLGRRVGEHSRSPAWGQRHTLTLALSRRGRGNGEWRHERMACAVPLLVLRALIYVENDLVGPFSSFAGVPCHLS